MGHGIRWTGWRRSIRRGVVLAMLSTLVLILGVPSAHAASISVKRNDYNADGISDIVAMIVGGDCLYRWNGNSSGSFNAGQSVGCGWSNYFDTLTAVGDINSDGLSRGDLVAVADGVLHRWFGTSGGNFSYGGTLGSGWGAYDQLAGLGNLGGGGAGDLVAINVGASELWRWFGNGSGGFGAGSRLISFATDWRIQ